MPSASPQGWGPVSSTLRRPGRPHRVLSAWALACALALALLCPAARATSQSRDLTVNGVAVDVEFADTNFTGGTEALLEWIKRSVGIVSAYYGRFPTTQLHVRVEPQEGGGVQSGKTWGYHGGLIRVQVGREVSAAQLLNDWVLVHEMTHLALPDVGDEHDWLSEGVAVYVEGIARVQAGNRTQQDVFAEQIREMPRGMPVSGDAGLDHTHSWGRTYWGGAMFCFVADVEIHKRTQNRMGLQEALRAIATDSGGLAVDWPILRVLETGDSATGTTVLHDLYLQMKDKPVTPALSDLWAQLGVFSDGREIRLRDDAPWASVRGAIMRPHGATVPPGNVPVQRDAALQAPSGE